MNATPSPRAHDARGESRITTIDCLRGLAASAVVWFHITNGNPAAYSPEWLRASGRQGWLGVEMFFVISGFVIPHALRRANYHLKDYGPFLLRRIVRLDPPYFASIVVTMALAYASAALPGFRGQLPTYSVPQIMTHVAYANSFFGYRSINVVYWSLSLEFQYYLLIGLLFPLVASADQRVRAGTIVVLTTSALPLSNLLFVFPWFSLFVLGILSFYLRYRLVSLSWYFLGVGIVAVVSYLTLGIEVALVAVVTTLLIAFANLRNRLLLFLGDVSYSLYLLHVPIGGRVINAATRLTLGPISASLVAVLAFGLSVVAAYAFYRLIEAPARAWAARVQYGNRLRAPESQAHSLELASARDRLTTRRDGMT